MTVYMVETARGLVKIGQTVGDPMTRVRALQTASPLALNLVWFKRKTSHGLEKRLHRTFDHWRLEGEWFQPIVKRMFLAIYTMQMTKAVQYKLAHGAFDEKLDPGTWVGDLCTYEEAGQAWAKFCEQWNSKPDEAERVIRLPLLS